MEERASRFRGRLLKPGARSLDLVRAEIGPESAMSSIDEAIEAVDEVSDEASDEASEEALACSASDTRRGLRFG